MFAPIRPKPIIPICIAFTSFFDVRRHHRRLNYHYEAALFISQETCFNCLDLNQSSCVSLLACEPGTYECTDDFTCDLLSYDPRAQTQYVHIIVLDALVRRIVVVKKPCTNAGDLACCDRHADAATTDDNPTLCGTAVYC